MSGALRVVLFVVASVVGIILFLLLGIFLLQAT